MDQKKIFALVQVLRTMVVNNYNYATGNMRFDWLDFPEGLTPAMMKLQIWLNDLVGGSGKKQRLQVLEVIATLFGWSNGTRVAAVWASYESFKKSLGRGGAAKAYEETRNLARQVWGLGSTKELVLAEIYALISWFEDNSEALGAVEAIRDQPGPWRTYLAPLAALDRPSKASVAGYIPPPGPTYSHDELVRAPTLLDNFFDSLDQTVPDPTPVGAMDYDSGGAEDLPW